MRKLLYGIIVLSLLLTGASPDKILKDAVVDLARVDPAERPYIRYLSAWPREDSLETFEPVLVCWINHLTFRRKPYRPVRTPEGLYRLNLQDLKWKPEAWEKLARRDTYFAVSVYAADGTINRGWIDPKAYLALSKETHSALPVLRGDYFLARTSLERGGVGFFREGFYSDLLGLPKTEKELFDLVGSKEELGKTFLGRGGAVTESEVALHNRELQLFPSLVGGDLGYFWRSLDTKSNLNDQDVFEKHRGTIRVDGKEFVLSLPNGLNFYYITDGAGNQVNEVPQDVAQDDKAVQDVTVLVPRSCVTCHPKGVRQFKDEVSDLILDPNARLNIIRKKGDKDFLKQELEDYYLSPLGRTLTKHQESFSEAVLTTCGMEAEDFAKAYRAELDLYFYGRVTRETVIRETGFTEEEVDGYLARAGHSTAVRLRAGRSVTRENWDGIYHLVMKAAIYSWEEGNEANKYPAVHTRSSGSR